MSTRPPRGGATKNRLSAVLSAGLERKLSLDVCAPCGRNPRPARPVQPVQRRAAATDLLVENDVDTDWSRITAPAYPNGPRFTRGCPDDDPGCPDDDKVDIDPITLDEFAIGKDIMVLGCGHCYNPASLARWVRSKKSRKCVYNDYNMTSAELAEIGVTVEEAGGPWTDDLIRVEGLNGFVKYYRMENGVQVLTIVQLPNGQEDIFEGPWGEERKVRARTVDGDVHFFEGAPGEEHLIRKELSSGLIFFYSGDANEERLQRIEIPTGETQYYEGDKDEERLVRITYANTGEIGYYEGDPDQERRVKSVFANGEIQIFEGPMGEERKVVSRTESSDGSYTYTFFEGPDGEERAVRKQYNGTAFILEGPRGEERIVSQYSYRDPSVESLFD